MVKKLLELFKSGDEEFKVTGTPMKVVPELKIIPSCFLRMDEDELRQELYLGAKEGKYTNNGINAFVLGESITLKGKIIGTCYALCKIPKKDYQEALIKLGLAF